MTEQTPFSLLCRDRDQAAYGVVGAATVAVAFLNLNEVPKALNSLLHALAEYQKTDLAITAFHMRNSKKENQSNGNRTAEQSNAA